MRGLDITITTSAKNDEEAFALLLAFGMPFTREGRPGEESAAERRREQEEQERLELARQKAEAEQAALDALKEENPEAYEKPAAEPEGDEAAEGEGGGADAGTAPTET